jgi:hypothetical protein
LNSGGASPKLTENPVLIRHKLTWDVGDLRSGKQDHPYLEPFGQDLAGEIDFADRTMGYDVMLSGKMFPIFVSLNPEQGIDTYFKCAKLFHCPAHALYLRSEALAEYLEGSYMWKWQGRRTVSGSFGEQ